MVPSDERPSYRTLTPPREKLDRHNLTPGTAVGHYHGELWTALAPWVKWGWQDDGPPTGRIIKTRTRVRLKTCTRTRLVFLTIQPSRHGVDEQLHCGLLDHPRPGGGLEVRPPHQHSRLACLEWRRLSGVCERRRDQPPAVGVVEGHLLGLPEPSTPSPLAKGEALQRIISCEITRLTGVQNGSILTGHGSAVFGKPPGVELLSWVESVPNDGIIYFRSYLNQDTLLLTGPQALADVLQRNCYDFEKPSQLRSFLQRVQGDGLSVVEGSQHKFQRKALNPAFNIRVIKGLYPLFWGKARALVDALRQTIDKAGSSATVEMTEWASRASMDIIGVAALGKEFDTLTHHKHPIMLQFQELFEFTTEGAIYFAASMVLPQWLIEYSPFFKGPKEIMGPGVQRLRKAGYEMVQEKKNACSAESVDILSIILRADSFSDDNLVDQLITFLAAG